MAVVKYQRIFVVLKITLNVVWVSLHQFSVLSKCSEFAYLYN